MAATTQQVSSEPTKDQSPFDLSGGNPALDFVNTLDHRFRKEGPVELLSSYSDLLRFARQSKLLSAQQARLLGKEVRKSSAEGALELAHKLREAMASVFYSAVDGGSPPAAMIETLQEGLRSARSHQELGWKQSRLLWSWGHLETWDAAAELPVWMLTIAASELMTSDAMERVNTCSSENCRWLFLDLSKSHTRRWCNMKVCGNRMKARRFRVGEDKMQRQSSGI